MNRKNPWASVAMASLAGTCWLLMFSLSVGSFRLPRGVTCDFLSFYTGALAARQGALPRLYDLEYLRGLQTGLVPQAPDFVPFTRVPWFAMAMAPLTFLAVPAAFWVWIGIQAALFFGFCAWAFRRFGADALICCGLFLPTAFGLALGQDVVWILALGLAVLVLMENGRDGAAGVVLGLMLVKFHLILLFPLALLLQKRWRMLIGFSVAGLLQAVMFFALEGREGIALYSSVLRWWAGKSPPTEPLQFLDVRAILLNFGADSWWWAAIPSALVVVLAWICCRREAANPPLWRWFAAAITGSLLISPHVFRYDGTLLLLPILLCLFMSRSKFTRFAAGVAATPVPNLITALGPPFWCAPAVAILAMLVALGLESYWERAQLHALEPAPVSVCV